MVDDLSRGAAAARRRAARLALDASPNPILDELRATGTLGQSGYVTLLKIVAAVARGRGYPPPEGHAAWKDDAFAEVAHGWLAGKEEGRLQQLLATVDSDRALTAYIETAIVAFLNTQSRQTNRGAYGRAIRRHAKRAQTITVSPRPWRYALNEFVDELAFSLHPEVLHSAAQTVTVDTRPTWNSERRRAPIGRGSDIRAVLAHVLSAAAAPVVEQPTIVDVVLQRFGVAVDADSVTALNESHASRSANDNSTTASYTVDQLLDAAQTVWQSLADPKAKLVLGHYVRNATVRETAELTGLSKSAVDRRFQAIRTTIEETLQDVQYSDQVLAQLLRWSDEFAAGTAVPGSASSSHVEHPQ